MRFRPSLLHDSIFKMVKAIGGGDSANLLLFAVLQEDDNFQ